MNHPSFAEILPLAVGLIIVFFILSAVLLWLWNTTIPTIFGLRKITYWESFRLFLIASILFGRGCYSSSAIPLPLPPPARTLQGSAE